MIKSASILKALAVCCSLHLVTSEEKFCKQVETPEIKDFYWRDYDGFIPHDAVPGGIDRKGLTTYIGQVMQRNAGSLVGTIYQGDKKVAVATGDTHLIDQNIMILCSDRPEKFKWISTNNEKIDAITNCYLVTGDFDYDYQGNIGRVNFEEEIIVGKILRRPLGNRNFYIPYRGKEMTFTHYEVLAYGCK